MSFIESQQDTELKFHFKSNTNVYYLKMEIFYFNSFESSEKYTQSPIIRNGPIRLSVEFWGKFKKRALGRSNLRNA